MGIRNRLKKSALSRIPSDGNCPSIASLEMIRGKDVAVVIHTCDAYAFCWPGWHFHFSRHWNMDENCNIYFANESAPITFPGIIPLPTGAGPWADRLRTALHSLSEDYVFYLQEDFWPTRSIDLCRHFQVAQAIDADALRITSDSAYYLTYRPFDVGGVNVRRFTPRSRYLVTHAASLWKREFLLSCLVSGESPWQNEIRGTERLWTRDTSLFLTVNDWYVPTCRQGQLTAEGLEMDREARESINAAA